jgi:bis(5'-adenosyl)-triphosphatase
MLPRKPGDFRRNDDVYEELETQELDDAFRRVARTHEEMAAEASTLRMLFPENTLNF